MALTAFQREVQALARRLGLRGDAERQVYSRPEYNDLLQSFFGNVPLPPGVDPSMVTEQSAGILKYKDAEGYEHILRRNLDGSSPDVGRVNQDETNRPSVLPVNKQSPETQQVINQAVQSIVRGLGGGTSNPDATTNQTFFGLPFVDESGKSQGVNSTQTVGSGSSQPPGGRLNNLSPEDKALLDTITKADLSRIRELFTSQGGGLVAQLFGRGMQQSSLAGDAVAKLTREQGETEGRLLADAAAREIQAREFLTQLASGENLEMFKTRTGASVDLINALTGNDTTRAVASGNIGLGQQQLGQQTIQDARQYQLELKKLDLAKQAQSPWRSILSTVASLGAAAIPGLGILGGLGGATRGTSTFPAIGMEG